MGLISEFKTFAMRGNVLDMAVGIIIGGAFGKIVSSFVTDVLMPPIGLLIGGIDFSDIKLTLKDAVLNGNDVVTPAITMNLGLFLNTVIDFTIVAFAIFLLIKGVNNLSKKKAEEPAPTPAPPPPSKEELLLAEIRDILKNK